MTSNKPQAPDKLATSSAVPPTPSFLGSVARWTRVGVNVLSILVFLACVAGIVWLRVKVDSLDSGWVYVMTVILGFFAVIALIVKFLLWRRLPILVRLTPVVILFGLFSLSLSILRIERVDGSLRPTIRLRWTPKPDQLIGAPRIAENAGKVDLVTMTKYDFPHFLGPDRNLKVTGIQLERDWTRNPPRELWRRPIGAGWSGFSAVNGYAVTMEQRGAEELVSCYEIATGDLKWVHSIDARHETIAGSVGPRGTPTIDEGLVYAFGATGILRCIDGGNGQLIWTDNILQRYGVTPEDDMNAVAWGRSASPLVVDHLVIVPFGGPAGGPYASLAAYEKKTGELVWKAGPWQVSYSSPDIATLGGIRQIVIVNENMVSGHRPNDGEIIWSHKWDGSSNAQASVSQAVVLPGDRLLLSKAYGYGAALIQLSKLGDGKLEAEPVWARSSVLKTKFTNVVVVDGYIYGLSDAVLECVELDTGKRQWKDRRRGNFGHGQILNVGDVILVQAESGEVVMVEVNPDKLVELGRFDALTDQTWNNLCLYGKYLVVRNAGEAACYELPLRK